MDEAPAYLASRNKLGHHNSRQTRPRAEIQNLDHHSFSKSHLFCFSSIERLGVKRVMQCYVNYLESVEERTSDDFLTDLSYTLGCRRSNMDWRGFIIASSFQELALRLNTVDEESFKRSPKDKAPRICFAFCGQGSQWAGMGRDLVAFEAFRDSLEAASYFLSIYLGSPFNLLEELFATADSSRISEPEVSQPATTALQVALVDLLSALSIKPSCVVGHSSGEIAAAYASGFITRETAWEVAYWRGVAAASLASKAPKLKGRMVAVGMSLEAARAYVEPVRKYVQVACINSPRSVTLSGRAHEISIIAKELCDKAVFCKMLPVKTAYHSEHMKLVEHDYMKHLAQIEGGTSRPQVAMFSSLTGQEINGEHLKPSYWIQNMVSPVNYLGAVREMMKLPTARQPSIIVEIGPLASLRTPTLDILADTGSSFKPTVISVLERGVDGEASLLRVVGDLWAQGHVASLKYAFTRSGGRRAPKCLVDLPPYPWNHSKTYWHESHLGEANRFRKYPRQDLIGAPTADAIPFQPRWRGFLRISENPWLQDHQVQKTIIYPAAGMVAMVLEAAKQMSYETPGLLGYEILNMRIEKAMLIPSTSHGLETALNMKILKENTEKRDGGSPLGTVEFSIYSKHLDAPWENNASGCLRFRYPDGSWQAVMRTHDADYRRLSATCTEAMIPRQLYELLDTVGMNYGSLFQNIVDVRKGGNSCVSKIRIPNTRAKMPAQFEYPHLLHPATLDSMFQTLFAIDAIPMVPTFIESLFVSADVADSGAGHKECFEGRSTAWKVGIGDAKAEIVMKLGNTQSYVIVKGLVLTGLTGSNPEEGGFLPNHRNLCTEIVWKEDVTFQNLWPVPLLDYINQWAHKYPGMSIMQVGGACTLPLAILDSLTPAKGEASKLSRFTVANLDASEAAQILRLLADAPLARAVEAVKIDGSEPLADFDLVLVDSTTVFDAVHLKKYLKTNSRMLKVTSYGTAVLAEPLEGTEFRSPPSKLDVALLHPDRCSVNITWLTNWLSELSAQEGLGDIMYTPVSRSDLVADPSIVSGRIVLSLLDFHKNAVHGSFIFNWSKVDFDLFHNVQKTAKGIVWITQGAQMECSNPKASPIVALGRTLMSEDPLKTIVTLDLDIDSRIDSREVCNVILYVLSRTFAETTKGVVREMEYAEKGGKLHVPRLDLIPSLNGLIEGIDGGSMTEAEFCTESSSLPALKLTIIKPGLMSDGISFVEFDQRAIYPSEVEIAFERTMLSFPDLENALGHTEDPKVGMDVVGRVIRKGSSVIGLEVGTQVMALVSGGALQSSIITDSRFTTAFQPDIVPSCHVTAYFALFHIGRVGSGRTVLVHAGASTPGLAAIQLCFLAGAEVFATLMGRDMARQREILRMAGLADHRIIDASSEGFANVILERTGGKGVDVVYNPTQEHVELSAECVRRCKL